MTSSSDRLIRVTITAILFGIHANTAWTENRFGPEIELHSVTHKTIHICIKGGVYFVTGVLAYPIWARQNREDISPVYNATTFGVGFGCYAAFLLDGKLSELYLKKIEQKLQPRVDSSELKVEWQDSVGEMKRKGLKLTYPSGDYIVFSSDPQTIEVTMNPQTSGELIAKTDFYDQEIYELAKSVGLRPPVKDGFWNGGHIHIDLDQAFGGDPQKFKNFIIDFWSHGELARGILVDDPFNAGPIRSKRQLRDIKSLAEYLDVLSVQGKRLTSREI